MHNQASCVWYDDYARVRTNNESLGRFDLNTESHVIRSMTMLGQDIVRTTGTATRQMKHEVA